VEECLPSGSLRGLALGPLELGSHQGLLSGLMREPVRLCASPSAGILTSIEPHPRSQG
jgi:hypothetical protein